MPAEKIEKLIKDAVKNSENNFEFSSCFNVIARNQEDFEKIVKMGEEGKWNLICKNLKICLGKSSNSFI
jgi:hypothetical protein